MIGLGLGIGVGRGVVVTGSVSVQSIIRHVSYS